MLNSILMPVLVQVFLTLIVWWGVFYTRFKEAISKQVPPEKFQTRADVNQLLVDSQNVNNNLINLCELPVLFYVLALISFITGITTPFILGAAWLFVVGRIAHSIIHCTYNHVMQRFYAYFISTLSLQVLFVAICYSLLAG